MPHGRSSLLYAWLKRKFSISCAVLRVQVIAFRDCLLIPEISLWSNPCIWIQLLHYSRIDVSRDTWLKRQIFCLPSDLINVSVELKRSRCRPWIWIKSKSYYLSSVTNTSKVSLSIPTYGTVKCIEPDIKGVIYGGKGGRSTVICSYESWFLLVSILKYQQRIHSRRQERILPSCEGTCSGWPLLP